MSKWPRFPVVYEINTRAWLDGLRRDAGKTITLGDIPQYELERLSAYGFDGLWLMGVWQRSPTSRQIAREHPDLQAGYREALSDLSPADVVGSPYAVYAYQVDESLGGNHGLSALRKRLKRLGLRLILDFVPNHVAVDHAWIEARPERILQASETDLASRPEDFFF